MELNMQPKEKPVYRADGALEIVGSPWLTIQGEGPYAGSPAVFIRMAGCDLQCNLCDTDYTSNRRLVGVEELLGEVKALMPRNRSFIRDRLIVLTGGEPFRQNLEPFLLNVGGERPLYYAQIETNGTLPARGMKDRIWFCDQAITLVCSPKTPRINPYLAHFVNVYKYILHADHVDPQDGLPTSSLGYDWKPARPHYRGVRVYVQPLDENDLEKNKRHEQAAVQSCLKFGYRLSIQQHKILGLP